jgi:hypothetical protein
LSDVLLNCSNKVRVTGTDSFLINENTRSIKGIRIFGPKEARSVQVSKMLVLGPVFPWNPIGGCHEFADLSRESGSVLLRDPFGGKVLV